MEPHPSDSQRGEEQDASSSSFGLPLPSNTRQLTARSAAVVRAATYHERSDSVLSLDPWEHEDDDDEEDDDDAPPPPRRRPLHTRAPSLAYMEQASMEASLEIIPSHDDDEEDNVDDDKNNHTEASTAGAPASPQYATKIAASGSLGRRRYRHDDDESDDEEDEEAILVMEEAAREAFLKAKQRTLSDREDSQSWMDKSERNVFTAMNRSSSRPLHAIPEQKQPALPRVERPILQRSSTAQDVLQEHQLLPPDWLDSQGRPEAPPLEPEVRLLATLFRGFCTPEVSEQTCRRMYKREVARDSKEPVPSAEPGTDTFPPHVVCLQPQASKDSSSSSSSSSSAVVRLLTAGLDTTHPTSSRPALLQLPLPFSRAFLNLLIRLLTDNDDYDEQRQNADSATPRHVSVEDECMDPNHAANRPHVLYCVARLQCTWPITTTGDPRGTTTTTTSSREGLLARPAVQVCQVLLSLAAASAHHGSLVAPLARLGGLLGVGGVTPGILRRWCQNALSTPESHQQASVRMRLAVVRAMTTAAAGSIRSAVLKSAPPAFFVFGGGGKGVERTISGLATWPFRNDFGMALWFRAEHMHHKEPAVLLRAVANDGGGVAVSLVRMDDGKHKARHDNAACTIVVSVYDAGQPTKPAHVLTVRGCVLLPRVWYHLAVRHTRSRLKGVFSLSTRQQLSVMLDGKILLTEPLAFPKMTEADFREDNSLLASVRRSTPHNSINWNLTLQFGHNFDGQTGALYIFHDNVSEASFRALYEATGGRGSNQFRRQSSMNDSWDRRRSDIVRKSRILDVNITVDDAEEIVLSQRRMSTSSSSRRVLSQKDRAVLDFGEGGEDDEESTLPTDLLKAAFGSKVFLAWDPQRTLGSLALELHVGAHLPLDHVYAWDADRAQDVIGSIGGVQSLIPLFKSFLGGDLERSAASHNGDSTDASQEKSALWAAIPGLLRLIAAFVQDHSENARELLRCGGVDVMEHVLFGSKKLAKGKGSLFGALASNTSLARSLVEALLALRTACTHYVGLETKVFSRLLFNIPLWLGGVHQVPGVALHIVLLPVLSSLTRLNPEKVRDCVGIKPMVHALGEYCLKLDEKLDGPDLDRFESADESSGIPLSHKERRRASDFLLAMIFEVFASGTTPQDLAPFLNFISFHLDSEWSRGKQDTDGGKIYDNVDSRRVATKACTVLLLLLQVRTPISGLYESFAHCCGSVQGGVGWILSVMVNSIDDEIRSLGVRCVACYLEVTAKGSDLPLGLDSTLSAQENDTQPPDIGSPVFRASNRLGMLAKGLAAMGPGVRSIVLPPSKLTAGVVVKLLWHLLRAHRHRIGPHTHAALLSWMTDDNGIVSSSMAALHFVRNHFVVLTTTIQPGYCISMEWADSILAQTSSIVGKSLQGPLAIASVMRLLKHLDAELKDKWLADLQTLAKSSRKSMSLLASLEDFQPSLFLLVSETLELVTRLREQNGNDFSGVEGDGDTSDSYDPTDSLDSAKWRLDLCLELYSAVLGHLVRDGGDKALEAVETAASLQRTCVNGRDVLLLILSGLCADLFDHGTLLEIGSITAQDWKDVDLEQESLPLKQSARLVTDAILSKGTKGLDMTAAVRSWRSLRHLTEVISAVVTSNGFGVVELFDYVNQRASAVDTISGGLHGIRLADGRLTGLGASEYVTFVQNTGRPHTVGDEVPPERDLDRRLCVLLSAQILTLLDAFIFPESLDASLPASQLHALALVRNSEPRLGSAQGPLVLSAIRVSFLLLSLLEPCSVKFLQCASRLRCLLYWALELVRDSSVADGQPVAPAESVAQVDRLVVAIVLHCHRALGRCGALLSEIESTSHSKYFQSRDGQKKHHRRLLRVALELRDVVSTAYRGRNDVLKATLSAEAYEALRSSLEGSPHAGKSVTKESVLRDFLSSKWVTDFQDVDTRLELSVPEQVAMDTIPLGSGHDEDPSLQGLVTVEKLEAECKNIVSEFDKAINGCFESYLEAQRKWAETDAVRELESDGDGTMKRLVERYKTGENELAKAALVRRNGADNRWKGIQRKAVEPWKSETHWRLAPYTDRLGRRSVLVQNTGFNAHKEASYDLALGKEREKEERGRQERLLEKERLSAVMRRNAEAFVVSESTDEIDPTDDESSLHQASDGESSTDAETSTDADSFSQPEGKKLDGHSLDDHEPDDEWDKIDSDEIQDVDAEGDIDAWAKAFIWSDNESVVARFDPVVIVSLQSYVEGKVLLTTHGLYFHQVGEEINVMTREAVETSESTHDTRGRRWRLSRLVEVHGRRYMLRPQALELFFSDSHELFLNFPGGTKERDRFHAKLRNSCKVPMLWSPKSLNPRTVFRRSKLTELWRKRKISNFTYLMALNRMAGRSFNDITQYPVFPWVLADFTSETIDLSDSRVYRDLTKPIGALNPDRLAQLLERYKDLELFGFTEAEKFLYGSHYSSPGIVLHYLIRQEPFTTMAIELQSGRFDCPDRLFFDLAASWTGCLTSTSDMKELIPEFFYLPEMFVNTNQFPLGRTQSGRPVDNVVLPPWAKGSAFEFVRIQRLALESDYVSQNLNHWIDLIFGYKQRGVEAEAAHNVFHHLSYEGSVDMDKITDEIDRQAAESHIQNFGQTPSQLVVDDAHPPRYAADECWRPLIYDPSVPASLRCHTPSKQFGNKRSEHAKGSVLKILVLSDTILSIYADLSVGSYRWVPSAKGNRLRMDKLKPLAGRELSVSRAAMKRGSAVSATEIDQSRLSIGNWSFALTVGGLVKEELRRKTVMSSGRLITGSETTLATAETSALLLSCGYWDGTVKIHGAESSRLLVSENGGHRGAIRCLAMGKDGALMLTGGHDATVRVWVVDHPDMAIALSDGYVQTALGASNDGEQALSCCHVLWGHDSPIVCVDLDSDMDVGVSGSVSGLVCIHMVRRGEFIRSFRPPAISNVRPTGPVSKLALGTESNMVVHMEDGGLHTFTVNGVRLSSTDAGEHLHDMKICSNDEMLITGGDSCRVLIRTVVDLQICSMLDLTRHGPIRCIALTPDDLNPVNQYLFIGSDDGMITVVDQDLSIKS